MRVFAVTRIVLRVVGAHWSGSRSAAGALSIGLAMAAGFGGLLLMLAVDMHEVLAWTGEPSAAVTAAAQLGEGRSWT